MTGPFLFMRRAGCVLTIGLFSAIAAPAAPEVSRTQSRRMPATRAVSVRTLARSHWEAISQGNVTSLMADYSPDAVFHWKEGAFEGDHIGTEGIRTVWIKFAKVRSPLTLAVQNVQEKGGSQGSRVVTADVTFRNANWTYPLAYRLVFRGGKIVEETWQFAEPEADPVLLDV